MGRCDNAQAAVTGCQCAYASSTTIAFTGAGTTSSPHTAAVKRSATAGNAVQALGDGVYVPRLPRGGMSNVASDENGYFTLTHNLPATPTRIAVWSGGTTDGALGGTADMPGAIAVGTPNATNVLCRAWRTNATAFNDGTFRVWWEAYFD